MGDVAGDEGQQRTERVVGDRLVEGGMAHPGADGQRLAVALDLVEALDRVDVDQMGRLGEPEGHDRHQALAAGQHPAVFAGHLRQDRQRLVERAWHMVDEGRGLHGHLPGA